MSKSTVWRTPYGGRRIPKETPAVCLPEHPNMLFNAHKKTIESLQHTLAQHTSLLDAIERSMAVIEFDLHGNVLRANANFLQRF